MARRRTVWVLGLILFTLLVRGGWLALTAEQLAADPDGYRALAENLLEHGLLGSGGRPTAYRPPLYPLLLAPCLALTGSPWAIGVAHLLLGAATVLVTFWLALHWLNAPSSHVIQKAEARIQTGIACLAAGLVACDPILLNQASLVMTETLATFLAALCLAALTRLDRQPAAMRALVAGICLGLASLCRPTFLPWTLAVVLWSAWRLEGWAVRARVAGALCLGAGLVLSPWAIRNQRHFGRPVISTTHGGYTLLLGNNPSFYAHLADSSRQDVWKATELDEQVRRWRLESKENEVENDRREYRRAWQNIARQPAMFLWASTQRVGRLWAVAPRPIEDGPASGRDRLRLAVGAWYAGLYLLASLGVWAIGRQLLRRPWVWGLLQAATFTAVHTLYWSDMRMRAPLTPVVTLAAAAGAGWLASRWLSAKR
ncbi:MAG: hypothetical protein WD403_09725 [Pirellulales bacterium]